MTSKLYIFVLFFLLIAGCGESSIALEGNWIIVNPANANAEYDVLFIKPGGTVFIRRKSIGSAEEEMYAGRWRQVSETKIEIVDSQGDRFVASLQLKDKNTVDATIRGGTYQYIRE